MRGGVVGVVRSRDSGGELQEDLVAPPKRGSRAAFV
jgi:hypothetical protein